MYRQAIINTYRLYRGEFLAMVVALTGAVMLSFSLVAAPVANAVSIGGPSDCDNNAIVRCGVHSTAAAVNAYNSRAYVRGVYAEFGITKADMASFPSTAVAGKVTKSGNVFVDGKSKAVATNAVTGGQQNIPGSTRVNHQGAVFYRRPPSVSFQQSSLPAFVVMKNNQFQFAIIASCGNAVSAKPTSQPKVAVAPAKPASKPKPQKPQKPAPTPPAPAPTQTQTQSQSQEVNVNNTNVNNNTQITEQNTVTKVAAAKQPAKQPQPTAQTTTVQPSTQTTATTLPNTGPTGVIGAFLIAVGLGTFGYRRLLLSRIER